MEFRWESVVGAWSVRRMRDGRAKIDNAYVPVGVAPITAIAWRVAHLIDVYGSSRNWVWLRANPPQAPSAGQAWRIAWTAGESISMLRAAIDGFVGLLRSTTDDLLWEAVGPVGGPYADNTLVSFVHHQLDEAIHHGAEVGILRDLYLARSYVAPAPATVADAADAGRWDLVESMVEDGYDVNETATGRTALHQAAANGDLDIVRLLVEHGAAADVEDPLWHLRPSEWARQFARTEVEDYLRNVTQPATGE